MAEVVDWLEHGDLDAHVVVRAAMAHLHVEARERLAQIKTAGVRWASLEALADDTRLDELPPMTPRMLRSCV
ncbi:MAG: hypothetical protein JWO02_4383 [Solirubrobacterales bacterium]|nr:hypothetical protein [Solirubrobacterales bacterium]